jgi:hypothetical protein
MQIGEVERGGTQRLCEGSDGDTLAGSRLRG